MGKPLLKHWKEGHWQVMIWLRSPQGSTIEYDTAEIALAKKDHSARTAYLAIMCACDSVNKKEIKPTFSIDQVRETATELAQTHPRMGAVRDLLARMSPEEYAFMLDRKIDDE